MMLLCLGQQGGNSPTWELVRTMLATQINVLARWLGVFGTAHTLFGLTISIVAALLLRPIPLTGA